MAGACKLHNIVETRKDTNDSFRKRLVGGGPTPKGGEQVADRGKGGFGRKSKWGNYMGTERNRGGDQKKPGSCSKSPTQGIRESEKQYEIKNL